MTEIRMMETKLLPCPTGCAEDLTTAYMTGFEKGKDEGYRQGFEGGVEEAVRLKSCFTHLVESLEMIADQSDPSKGDQQHAEYLLRVVKRIAKEALSAHRRWEKRQAIQQMKPEGE